MNGSLGFDSRPQIRYLPHERLELFSAEAPQLGGLLDRDSGVARGRIHLENAGLADELSVEPPPERRLLPVEGTLGECREPEPKLALLPAPGGLGLDLQRSNALAASIGSARRGGIDDPPVARVVIGVATVGLAPEADGADVGGGPPGTKRVMTKTRRVMPRKVGMTSKSLRIK